MIGPIPSKKYSEIIFLILSPDPLVNKEAIFLKYPIYVDANRATTYWQEVCGNTKYKIYPVYHI